MLGSDANLHPSCMPAVIATISRRCRVCVICKAGCGHSWSCYIDCQYLASHLCRLCGLFVATSSNPGMQLQDVTVDETMNRVLQRNGLLKKAIMLQTDAVTVQDMMLQVLHVH